MKIRFLNKSVFFLRGCRLWRLFLVLWFKVECVQTEHVCVCWQLVSLALTFTCTSPTCAACTRRSNLSEDPEYRAAVWGFRLRFAAALWFYCKLCVTASVRWALNFLWTDGGNHYHTLTPPPESLALSLREQTLSHQREVGNRLATQDTWRRV